MSPKQSYSIDDVYRLIEDFRKEMREIYVTKDEFEPVKNILYGVVSVVLITVVGAILTLVIKSGVVTH